MLGSLYFHLFRRWHSFRVLNEGEKKNSHVIIALKFRHHKHQTNNSPACDVSQTKHPWMPQHVPELPEIPPLLTPYLSIFALVVIYKEQNSISRLNPTGNIPRNSLEGGPQEKQEEQGSAEDLHLSCPQKGTTARIISSSHPPRIFQCFSE